MGRINNESRDWMVHAACRNHNPELFFPHSRDFRNQNLAINVCRPCPVKSRCEQYALDHDTCEGVWAGRFLDGAVRLRELKKAAQRVPSM